MYALIIRTKGIRSNVVYLIISLQNPLIRFLVFRGYIGKVIQVGLALVAG
jgi:hypothetical protein